MYSSMTEQGNSSSRCYIRMLDINTMAVTEPSWERELFTIREGKRFTCQTLQISKHAEN